MRIALSYYSILLGSLSSVQANVEKTIFTTARSINAPKEHPNRQDLRLDALSPSRWRLRRELPSSFPIAAKSRGTETWLLLERLVEQQRYEVRICWAATVSSTILSSRGILHVCCDLTCDLSLYVRA